MTASKRAEMALAGWHDQRTCEEVKGQPHDWDGHIVDLSRAVVNNAYCIDCGLSAIDAEADIERRDALASLVEGAKATEREVEPLRAIRDAVGAVTSARPKAGEVAISTGEWGRIVGALTAATQSKQRRERAMAEPLNPEKVEYQEFMHTLEGMSVETVKEVAWRHYAASERAVARLAMANGLLKMANGLLKMATERLEELGGKL